MIYRTLFFQFRRRQLKLVALLVLCLAGSPLSVYADEISLVADVWCPYNCEPDTNAQGLIVDVAKAAFERHGHKVVYKTMPWARAIEETRTGKYDAIIGAYKEDAPDFVFPEEAQSTSSDRLFVLAQNKWRYTGLDSLAKVSIGVIRDYSYGEPFDSYLSKNAGNPTLIQVASGDDALSTNVNKLRSGRIQAVIEDSLVMGYFLHQNKLNGQLISAGELGLHETFVAFSPNKPNSKKWAKLLSDEVVNLKKDGTYNTLKNKYGISDPFAGGNAD